MRRQKIETEVKKNWWVIAAVFVCNLISTIPAYFLSGTPSVVATLVVIVITTGLGYFMLTRVITKTWLD
jgi:hypothetical protein